MLVSIIMPVRNGLPYVEECLISIIKQSYINWELIVVDDHSTDDTLSVLNSFSKQDARIHVYQNTGRGIIDALTLGYSYSNGEFVTRMDADDVMPIDKLLTLHYTLLKSGQKTVATGHVQYFSATKVNDGYRNYETWLNTLCSTHTHYQDIYKECVIPSPCWMMYRNDFESIGGFGSSEYPEDYDLCFRMYKHEIKVVPSNEILHHWRDHGARASRNDENYADNRFLDIKLKYFLEIEHPKQNNINLLGAGKKGKYIAHKLTALNVPFNWYTNNQKKIGKDIYGNILLDFETTAENTDTNYIITIANKSEQQEVKSKLHAVDLSLQFWFC